MRRILVGLAVVLAASAPASAELQIKDVRPLYGVLGPPRKSLDVYPGDDVYFSFVVTGAATDDKGNVDAATTLEAFDADGKQVLNQTAPINGVLALGGESFMAVSHVNFGADVPPGEYKVSVTIKDRIKDGTASFERKVVVKPLDFTFVQLHFAYDEKGATPAPVGGVPLQKLFLAVKAVGFDRSQKKIKVTMKAQVLDEKGKDMMPLPLTTTAASDDEKEVAAATEVNFNANLSLNRVGTFTLRLTFTDEIGKKTATLETPLKVTGP
jgi:hypothetical protein